MATVKFTITVKKRWYFPELFALARLYIALGLVDIESASAYLAVHGFRYSLKRVRVA